MIKNSQKHLKKRKNNVEIDIGVVSLVVDEKKIRRKWGSMTMGVV